MKKETHFVVFLTCLISFCKVVVSAPAPGLLGISALNSDSLLGNSGMQNVAVDNDALQAAILEALDDQVMEHDPDVQEEHHKKKHHHSNIKHDRVNEELNEKIQEKLHEKVQEKIQEKMQANIQEMLNEKLEEKIQQQFQAALLADPLETKISNILDKGKKATKTKSKIKGVNALKDAMSAFKKD